MERFGQAARISAHYAAKDAPSVLRPNVRDQLDKVGAIKSCHVDSFERPLKAFSPST